LRAVPATELVLCRFVSYLAEAGLRVRTIKVYLSAIRFLHIREGVDDPFSLGLQRLHYVLQGIKRSEVAGGTPKKIRLPITPDILRKLKVVWDKKAADPDTVMIWAACCLGFFAFLRSGEMTVPSDVAYDPACHLGWKDITVDNPLAPQMIRVTIKQSKTDPFRKGIDLFVGRTGTKVCPVVAIVNYLATRGKRDGPLFMFKDGRFLTRQRLVDALRLGLQKAGLDNTLYCGHSFRIGAATTAAQRGLEDSVIKTLGRWESVAYLEYIRIKRDQLAVYSKTLC
jgi:hypothetical protein